MQLNVLTILVAAMASVAAAETVTVYACPSSTATSAGVASASGHASATIASTGVISSSTATTSPIAYATGAASSMQVSAFGLVVAAGVALFI